MPEGRDGMLKVKEERQCLVCLQFKDVLEFPRICGGGNACTPRQHICRACKKVACNAATKAKYSASIRRRDRERKRREAERIRALGYGKGNGGWEYKPNQRNQYAELTALRCVEILGVKGDDVTDQAWESLCRLLGGEPLPVEVRDDR